MAAIMEQVKTLALKVYAQASKGAGPSQGSAPPSKEVFFL